MFATADLLASISTIQAGGRTRTDAVPSGGPFAELLAAQPKAPLPIEDAAVERIQEFQDWQAEYLTRGISADRREQVQGLSGEFERIIRDAAMQGEELDASAYLRSLTFADQEVLRQIHGLAKPIDALELSDEGSINLLRSPGHVLDVDKDGFQMVGLAKRWQFPPVDAPESVKQAWAETTAKLSESDLMLLQGAFLPLSLPTITGQSAYLGPDADYRAIVQGTIESAEFSARYDAPWQIETRQRELAMLRTLLGKL